MGSNSRPKRLKNLIKALKSNNLKFSEQVGVNPQYISHIINDVRPLTEKTIDKIIKRYPEINKNWLMYGIGPMFISDIDEVKEPSFGYDTTPLSAFQKEWDEIKRRVETLEDELKKLKLKHN